MYGTEMAALFLSLANFERQVTACLQLSDPRGLLDTRCSRTQGAPGNLDLPSELLKVWARTQGSQELVDIPSSLKGTNLLLSCFCFYKCVPPDLLGGG